MERATIYRAISAPAALVGGALSMAAGLILFFAQASGSPAAPTFFSFLAPWLLVLAATLAANLWFLYSDAQRRGESFISAGMRMAARSVAPPLLCAGAVTLVLAQRPHEQPLLAISWCVFYGLALLSTAHFAPGSINILGWCFLSAGLALLVLETLGAAPLGIDPARKANLIMAATFGAFHLAYAACTWPKTTMAAVRQPS